MRRALLISALGVVGLGIGTVASSGSLTDRPVLWMNVGGSGGGPPSLGAPYTEWRGLAAVSPAEIWAVGVQRSATGERGRIQHWDGAAWSVAAHVKTGGQVDIFNAVGATSPSDVWAVGYSAGIGHLQEGTLIEHWDGHAWTHVPSPNPSDAWNELDGVVALSPTNAWAVGYAKRDNSPAEALVEHWNGTSWDRVPAASPAKFWNQLVSIAARGPRDLWAVGWQQGDSSRTALLEHYDGVSWTAMPADAGQQFNALAGSGGQLWAAGASTLRLSGTDWRKERMPTSADGLAVWSASASAADDAWVVGSLNGRGGERAFVEHWDGATWKLVALPKPPLVTRLTAVLSISSRDVWIAGTRQDVQPHTLLEHWDGATWSVIQSPE